MMNITKASLEVCDSADSFLQSSMWGEFKSRFGWNALAFLIEWDGYEKCPLLALTRRLAPGFSFAYIPWGPQLPPDFPEGNRVQALAQLAAKLKPLLSRNTAFIRFDPPWYSEDGAGVSHNEGAANFTSVSHNRDGIDLAAVSHNEDAADLTAVSSNKDSADLAAVSHNEGAALKAAGFKRAAADIQPPDTVIVNLNLPCEQILASMKPKWRYNVSLAGKKGVQVNTGEEKEAETFYSLLKETAQRDGIAIHSFEYYKTLFEICRERKKNGENLSLRLYTAVYENDTLAAIVVLFRARYAAYLYGASSNEKRNLMAPYALQWKAMQDAKEAGCRYYDLFGIPPNEDPNHPMAGLYRFKTGFGGQIIHRPGSWDFPYKPVFCSLFNFAETMRKKLRDRKKGIKASHK